MDVLAGAATSVRFELQSPTGTLIPDANSVSYRIFDQNGVAIGPAVPVTTTSVDTWISVPLPEELMTIDPARRFEKRTVVLNWTSKARAYSDRKSIRIIPFLNMTANGQQVRSALGLNDDELLDDEIDLFSAYLTIETFVTQPIMEAALASGTNDEVFINGAIVAQAALDILPTLLGRMMSAQTDGVVKSERFAKGPDLNRLQAALVARRDDALSVFVEITATVPILVGLTSPVDVITGLAS